MKRILQLIFLGFFFFIYSNPAEAQSYIFCGSDTLYRVDASGDVYCNGVEVGHIDETGVFTDVENDTLGWVTNNTVYMANGEISGMVSEGVIYSASGGQMGVIAGDGSITVDGPVEFVIGTVQGMAHSYAFALTFFFAQ